MTVWLATNDEDAKEALQTALSLAGLAGELHPVPPGTPAPSVLVIDTAYPAWEALLEELQATAPWLRVHLLSDDVDHPAYTYPCHLKPFDAAELAAVLRSEAAHAALDRQRGEAHARAELLSSLVEASVEAMVGLDAEGKVVTWNGGAERIYGFTAGEMTGRPIADLDLPADEEVPGYRLRRRKDGDHRWIITSRTATTRSDIPVREVEVSMDATDHRKLEEALHHSKRLAELGRISASMAHEVNNPLGVIQAAVSFLMEHANDHNDNELRECAQDLADASKRIQSFVRHVTGFARQEHPVIHESSLAATGDMAWRLIAYRAERLHISLQQDMSIDAVIAHDPPRIAQALVNLLSNAIDAAHREVSFRLEEAPGDGFRFIIDDDGLGIDPRIRARLFEPFVTTKPPGRGTGLGLSICRRIVDDHHGKLELLPRRNGGTRAVLTLFRKTSLAAPPAS